VPDSTIGKLNCNGRILDLSVPRVMGILNITPDSFSDGGDFFSPERALERAHQMVADGAAIIDIGGESTRPGAAAVPLGEELRRVIPVVEALASELPVPISIDTNKPEVMRAGIEAGAGLINDIMALSEPGALEAVAASGAAVCLMHMQGRPRDMQMAPNYQDVVAEVRDFLMQRLEACVAAGIPRERIVLDPGFGFGKNLAHNRALLKSLEEIVALGLPVLVGLSRKSMIGALLDRPPKERVSGSIAAAVVAVVKGARIVRAHDVRATVDAITVAHAVTA
jgi:dihydropteroate synthase